MRKTWPIVLLFATSCTTFSDLEREHPFVGCPDGTEQTRDGECVAPVEPNNVVGPNNSTDNISTNNTEPPNATTCEEGAPDCCDATDDGLCCETADGETLCCDEATDECCLGSPEDPNCRPPSNTDPNNFSSDYVLVIVDGTGGEGADGCAEPGADGADIFGVQVELAEGDSLRLYVFYHEPGAGGSEQQQAAAVLESFDVSQDNDECPMGESFSLGCGGVIAIGAQDLPDVDASRGAVVRVFESAPQCDEAEDSYAVLVCPLEAFQGGNTADCVNLASGVQGTTSLEINL